jgi:hypothetical protein
MIVPRTSRLLVHFVGEYTFPVTPEQMWDRLSHFDEYSGWWAWLRDFTAVPDDSGLSDGTQLYGTVVPPVRYRLALRINLDRCVRPSLVEATIDGDLRGEAVLQLVAVDGGSMATVEWNLVPTSKPLRVATRFAHPVVSWGHDQVVAMAVAGFRRRAIPIAHS